MDELNQALISQLMGGLKLRREDDKTNGDSSKMRSKEMNQGKIEGSADEDASDTDSEIDDEEDKELKNWEIDRRNANDQNQGIFNNNQGKINVN